MNPKSISEIAEGFGLTIEPEADNSIRIYKGVNKVFIGSEEAARNFFVTYDKERPRLFEESAYGYKE